MRRILTVGLIVILCVASVPVGYLSLAEAADTFSYSVTLYPQEGIQEQIFSFTKHTQIQETTIIDHQYMMEEQEGDVLTLSTQNEQPPQQSREKRYTQPYRCEIQRTKDSTTLVVTAYAEYYTETQKRKTTELTIEITCIQERSRNYLYDRLNGARSEKTVVPAETIPYLIITNETLYETIVDHYVPWKLDQDQTMTAIRVVNVSDIRSQSFVWVNGTYGDATNETEGNPWMPDGKEITTAYALFNDTPCHIRNYIRYMVTTYNTSYVLLVGDNVLVPPRLVEMHAHSGPTGRWYNSSDRPSDMYYANLHYSWNNNTNSVFGECSFDGFYWINDGNGVSPYDEIDWSHDVLVGRVPAQSNAEVENWIQKMEAYIHGSYRGEYLQNAIIATKDNVNAIDDSVWEEMGDEFPTNITFLNGQNISGEQFTILDRYVNGVEDGWDGCTILHHSGHSGTHSGTLWDVYRPTLLNNTNMPNILYSEGCHAGNFNEVESCIEDWMVDDGCSVVGIANSCWGWFIASTWFAEEMFALMFNETRGIHETCFAKAHYTSKEMVGAETHPVCPMIVKETNFFGDPSLTFQWIRALPQSAPVVTQPSLTNITETTLDVHTMLTEDGGVDCDVWFTWGETPSGGNNTTRSERSQGMMLCETLEGMQQNKTYYVQAWATNGEYAANSSALAFMINNTSPVEIPTIPMESTNGFGSEYATVTGLNISFTIHDLEQDPMDVVLYIENTPIVLAQGATNNTTIAYTFSAFSNCSQWYNASAGQWQQRNIFNHSTTYQWYVNITDGNTTRRTRTFSFTTSNAADLDEDGCVSIIDVSRLIGHYGCIQHPGGTIPGDINDDGVCDVDDIAQMTNIYGTTYYT